MKITDIIEKKKRGFALTEEEIYFVVDGAMNGSIADYQLSAFFMAVYFQGMNIDETTVMTKATVESGSVLDLSKIGEIVADKHSTGGVGDKITLIYLPLVSACGIPFHISCAVVLSVNSNSGLLRWKPTTMARAYI